jgi:hypothetical protein
MDDLLTGKKVNVNVRAEGPHLAKCEQHLRAMID